MTTPGSAIQVFTGGVFDPLAPDPALIRIEDIAHSLATQPRFLGHCGRPYSVAEHSVHVSRACAPEDALWGLLHDASEAYLGDMPTPLKRSKIGEAFVVAESRVMAAVCERFGLVAWEPESVSRADKAMLDRERKRAFPNSSPEAASFWTAWQEALPNMDDSELPEYCEPQFWGWEIAEMLFLESFAQLGGVR